MGGWAWFWIWTTLVIAALAVFALIGLDLGARGKRVLVEVEALQPTFNEFNELLETLPVLAERIPAIERDFSELLGERAVLVQRKQRKHDERQRRLIKHLQDIDPREKRFK